MPDTITAQPHQYVDEIARQVAQLRALSDELLAALKMSRECINYCRRAHKDAQSGEGVPVELFIDAIIAKAEAAGIKAEG